MICSSSCDCTPEAPTCTGVMPGLPSIELRPALMRSSHTYDAARGVVIYRSKLHATLKRNFQVIPGSPDPP